MVEYQLVFVFDVFRETKQPWTAITMQLPLDKNLQLIPNNAGVYVVSKRMGPYFLRLIKRASDRLAMKTTNNDLALNSSRLTEVRLYQQKDKSWNLLGSNMVDEDRLYTKTEALKLGAKSIGTGIASGLASVFGFLTAADKNVEAAQELSKGVAQEFLGDEYVTVRNSNQRLFSGGPYALPEWEQEFKKEDPSYLPYAFAVDFVLQIDNLNFSPEFKNLTLVLTGQFLSIHGYVVQIAIQKLDWIRNDFKFSSKQKDKCRDNFRCLYFGSKPKTADWKKIHCGAYKGSDCAEFWKKEIITPTPFDETVQTTDSLSSLSHRIT